MSQNKIKDEDDSESFYEDNDEIDEEYVVENANNNTKYRAKQTKSQLQRLEFAKQMRELKEVFLEKKSFFLKKKEFLLNF